MKNSIIDGHGPVFDRGAEACEPATPLPRAASVATPGSTRPILAPRHAVIATITSLASHLAWRCPRLHSWVQGTVSAATELSRIYQAQLLPQPPEGSAREAPCGTCKIHWPQCTAWRVAVGAVRPRPATGTAGSDRRRKPQVAPSNQQPLHVISRFDVRLSANRSRASRTLSYVWLRFEATRATAGGTGAGGWSLVWLLPHPNPADLMLRFTTPGVHAAGPSARQAHLQVRCGPSATWQELTLQPRWHPIPDRGAKAPDWPEPGIRPPARTGRSTHIDSARVPSQPERRPRPGDPCAFRGIADGRVLIGHRR